jgi:hypothetical protein
MGTRGISGFFYKKETKISYNHFDSYPSGLGIQILEFIKDVNELNGWDRLKQRVQKLVMVNDDDKPTPAQIKEYDKLGYSDTGVGGKIEHKLDMTWYQLLRQTQGSTWLNELLEGKVKHQIDSAGFIKDSLFCEWGYILNLDKMILEVYKGFNDKPQLKGNRYTFEPGCDTPYKDGNYYSSRLIKKFKLLELKSKEDIDAALLTLTKKDK